MYNISLIHWLSPMNFLDGQGHVKNIMGKLEKKKTLFGSRNFSESQRIKGRRRE